MTQSSVEWLAEKYNHVTWMRNRDEISAGMADEWRKHYLEQAQEMHKKEITDAFLARYTGTAEEYHKETFNTNQ